MCWVDFVLYFVIIVVHQKLSLVLISVISIYKLVIMQVWWMYWAV